MNFSIITIGSVLLFSFIGCLSSAAANNCAEESSLRPVTCSIALPRQVRGSKPSQSQSDDAAALARNLRAEYALTQSELSPPSTNSPKLRIALLAKAKPHLSPQWKNPGISERGLDPAIVTALQQQQAYVRSAHPGVLPGNSVPCSAPVIRTVNGRNTGVIFTPQMPNNSYRIEGCLFGETPGSIALEPHPADPAQKIPAIPLTVDAGHFSWLDNEIQVHLDSHLIAIPDVPVTLVIHLSEGRRVEFPGCLFVAARSDPKLLEAIPASWISLQPSSVRSRSIERLEYVSPPVKGSGVPGDAAGASAFVSRLDAENFGAGSDTYDFTQLNPGWVVDSVQLQTYAVSCPGATPTQQSSGHWDTQWNGRKLSVQLQDDGCTARVSPSFTFNLSVSQYALKVWVIGPVGTKPLADALLHSQSRSLTQTN